MKAIGCILVSWFLFYIGVEESPAIDNHMLWMNNTPIPADIAQKLGIEPKEG